jgi:uncharacterized OB-fold protein
MSDDLLVLDRCGVCGMHRLGGRYACAGCGAEQCEPVSLPASGSVTAVTRVDRSPVDSPTGEVPFFIAMVQLHGAAEVQLMGASKVPLEISSKVSVSQSDGAAPYLLVLSA